MTETVTCTVEDQVCRLTLNRPDKLDAHQTRRELCEE